MVKLIAIAAVVMFITVVVVLFVKILVGPSQTETIEGYLRLERRYNRKAQRALKKNRADAESFMEQAAMYREKARELLQQ